MVRGYSKREMEKLYNGVVEKAMPENVIEEISYVYKSMLGEMSRKRWDARYGIVLDTLQYLLGTENIRHSGEGGEADKLRKDINGLVEMINSREGNHFERLNLKKMIGKNKAREKRVIRKIVYRKD